MDAPLRIDYAGTSALMTFGRYAGGCGLGFHGDMDLVRLWSGALSPEAIAMAAAGSSAPTGPGRTAARRRSGNA